MHFQLNEQSNDAHLVKASKAPQLFLPMSVGYELKFNVYAFLYEK